jgi:hypothetical protein
MRVESSTAVAVGQQAKPYRLAPAGLLRDLQRPSQVFANLTPNWYASIMGTGIVAVAAVSLPWQPRGLHTCALVVWALAALLLVALTAATVTHCSTSASSPPGSPSRSTPREAACAEPCFSQPLRRCPRPTPQLEIPASRYRRMAAHREPARALAMTTPGPSGTTLDSRIDTTRATGELGMSQLQITYPGVGMSP